VLHAEGSDDWTLKIKYVQKRDNGTYECQVSEKQLVDIIFCAFFAGRITCIIYIPTIISIIIRYNIGGRPQTPIMWLVNDGGGGRVQ